MGIWIVEVQQVQQNIREEFQFQQPFSFNPNIQPFSFNPNIQPFSSNPFSIHITNIQPKQTSYIQPSQKQFIHYIFEDTSLKHFYCSYYIS